MRPNRSFILLFILLASFLALRLIFRETIADLPAINDFFPVLEPADASHESEPSAPDTLIIELADTLKRDTTLVSIFNLSDTLDTKKFTLPGLFDSLAAKGEQIRIMYYGDSQLEGDRISSYLRSELRRRYGGSGPGLFLPLMPVMYTNTLNIQSSSNWRRYNYLSYKGEDYPFTGFGPFMTCCRFIPPADTLESAEKAFVRITPSQLSDSSASVYEYLRLFYGNAPPDVAITVTGDGIELYSGILRPGSGVREEKVSLKYAREIIIWFSGKASPDIYGISIESNTGLVVDNLPQRGSAGLEFTIVDKTNLRDSYTLIGPDLFIMQYGLNVVRNLSSDYGYYEKGLYRQLKLLQELCPGVPVLLISLNDMAFQEGDSVLSYSNIDDILEAQKRAAEKAGALFWDSFSSMGGEGSIIRWADSKAPLAQRDYAHFTARGADSVSKMLIRNFFTVYGKEESEMANNNVRAEAMQPQVSLEPAPAVINPGQGRIMILINNLLSYNPEQPFIFTSPAFWIFFLFVLAGYMLVYKKLAMRSIYLFLISLYFYYKTGGLFLILLLLVTVTDYTLGILIHRSEKRGVSRFWLIMSLLSNLGLLAYFKYAEFITDSINAVAGTNLKVFDLLSSLSNSTLGTSFDTSYIILPVGISFFTFQSLSYTIDIYRKRMTPVKNILDFGFYVSFFPHLVAGPIVRASVFIPQIYSEYSLTQREFSHALFMIVKGLIKKIVISNFIAVNFVDRVFDAPALFSGFENLMAVYAYGLQIYCDFSGYTDIAIGVALIMGFRLPVNFNSPYKASTITDFWKRWHISLSQWLKDYLYFSLGGNRRGKIRTGFNLIVTMLLGGLWHGASLRFVIWGGLHGIALVVNKLWRSVTGSRGEVSSVARIAGILLTFNFVSFCWIFFRAESLDDVRILLSQIVNSFSPGNYSAVFTAYAGVFIVIIAGYLLHYIPETFKESYRALFISVPVTVQMAFLLLMAVFLWQMRSTELMPFIYFRF